MSITRGKHTFRFGGEVRRDLYDELGNSFPRGAFNFSGFATQNPGSTAGTGHAFADYMLGDVRTSDGAIILADTNLRRTGFSRLHRPHLEGAPEAHHQPRFAL